MVALCRQNFQAASNDILLCHLPVDVGCTRSSFVSKVRKPNVPLVHVLVLCSACSSWPALCSSPSSAPLSCVPLSLPFRVQESPR
jgi:hypothetical protein